jgi:hypothetical protein
MKIRFAATLEIPAEGVDAWLTEYGVDRDEIREDVRRYIRSLLWECTGAEVANWEIVHD